MPNSAMDSVYNIHLWYCTWVEANEWKGTVVLCRRNVGSKEKFGVGNLVIEERRGGKYYDSERLGGRCVWG